jgi:hypothetical protein
MSLSPLVAFQVKLDLEEELIHRGVQYSRAMKHFVKKFGRYPTRIEELENTNQIRFLRRRYKDPITGKDFKILHMGDVQLASAAGIAGATPPNGLNPAARLPGGTIGQVSGPDSNGVPTTTQLAGGLAAGANSASPVAGAGAAPAPNGAAAQNSDEAADNDSDAAPTQSGSHPAAGPGAAGTFGAVGQGTPAPGAQVFGGGPMVGVASTSKEKSIRVFNKKDHYNQWQFIYDPTTDRGGLLTTPAQGSLQGATALQQGVSGAPGAPGAAGAPGAPGTQGLPNTQGQPPGQPNQTGIEPPPMPPDQGP